MMQLKENTYMLHMQCSLIGYIIIFSLLVFASCKKERSCEGCVEKNKPPIAVAGSDRVITLPTDSVSLDGSSSSDPDGTISVWLWKKISGPASSNIINAASQKTTVNNLIAGTYQFELKVTDDKGASDNDTMIVTVDATITTNHPPIANAGADQTITLPGNTATLDGSGSTDPDNNITAYLWTKISGPSSFNISNSNSAQTQVNNLVLGVYHFELKVTDAGALFSKDTMQVIVNSQLSCGQLPSVQGVCDNISRPQVCAELVHIGNLSIARSGMSAATAGNKIIFAGGASYFGGDQHGSSRVDIYDVNTNTWGTAELSIGRHSIAAVTAGNKAFFAGGDIYAEGDAPVNIVDIFDASNNAWLVDTLPTLGGEGIAAAATGSKVLFAGFNVVENDVNIYDISNGSWTQHKLPDTRIEGASAVANGNKIYISGGWLGGTNISSTVHVYDCSTNAWTAYNMIEPKMYHTGTSVANKIYWAGGQSGNSEISCVLEIRNVQLNSSSSTYLSSPASWSAHVEKKDALIINNQIIFLRPGNNKFDIYDTVTDTWRIGILPQEIPVDAAVIALNNTIYIAGGFTNFQLSGQVWKLEF